MRLMIQDDNGNNLQEFVIPDNKFVTEKRAIEMGKVVAKSINELRHELIEFEKKLEENCDCFWIKQSPEERKCIRIHSPNCATWEM